MQAIVNAAPTAGEGERVAGMISALAGVGIDSGYLLNPRLAKVYWQAGDRSLPALTVGVAGESALWVDPPRFRQTATSAGPAAPWPPGYTGSGMS